MCTMPLPRASSGPLGANGFPSNSIAPESACNAPLITFMSVLFPAPFSPMSACTSPARSSKPTPSSATVAPKLLRISVSRNMGYTVKMELFPCEIFVEWWMQQRLHFGCIHVLWRNQRNAGIDLFLHQLALQVRHQRLHA